LAFQLRILRQKEGLSQAELASKLATSQNAISRIESPNYGKASLSTLVKLASFFDVGLIVRFASHSEIADWTTDLSTKSVDVPKFSDDVGFSEDVDLAGIEALLELRRNEPASNDLSMEPVRSEPGMTVPEEVLLHFVDPEYPPKFPPAEETGSAMGTIRSDQKTTPQLLYA
jgi:transcriptional regulator with XRE-family HTH domain